MKRHLTLSTTSQYARNQGVKAGAVADRTRVGEVQTSLAEAAHARPRLTLVSAPIWRHKLILTGKLDHLSTPELEEEIECLCQEGVTTLTLDLRQLEAIDSAGVTAIAFHGAACKRRGHDFAVITGSHVVHRALAEAGATDLLTPDPMLTPDPNKRVATNSSSEGSCSDRSTSMIKNL
jgi:anti-anti-sigma factor